MTNKTPRARTAGNKLTASAADAALTQLIGQSLLGGKDLQRLQTITRLLDPDTLQCSLDGAWEKLFEGLEPVNAETALRKLKQRLKEVQQEAIEAGQMLAHQLLELEVTKKSGDAPRFLWFVGPAGTTAQARTPDLESIPAPAIQDATALPPELLGIASSGSEPLLILTINDHETRAVREVFSPGRTPRQFLRDEHVYELLDYAEARPVIGYRCRMGSLSTGAALISTVKAIEHHRPAAVLGVGIAFGNKAKKQNLGDVLIASAVRSYEAERINPDATRSPRGEQIPVRALWVDRATRLEPIQFKLHKGLLLSGEKLLDNQASLLQLFQQFPDAIGGDMEGAGLMTACHEGKVDWLVIKAVSDWGDGNKSAIGEEEKDQHQRMAAQHAAEVAYAAIHLAWPTNQSQSVDRKGTSAPSEAKIYKIKIKSKGTAPLSLNIEAKTPDFKALDALLSNQGRSHGIHQRQSQTSPNAASNAPTMAAHESLLEWLQSPEDPPVFALLGEYGMGKTITCQRLYHELRQRRTEAHPPAWAREPLYFDLRTLSLFKNRERTQTVEMPDKTALINDLIKHGWRISPGQAAPTFHDIQALLSQGALLILDGLDECLVHLVDVQHPPFIKNLLELLTDADPDRSAGTRLLLSCRTNFFKTLDDQINFFTGQHRGKISAQWYRSLVLQPFTETQIRQYLEQVVPDVPADRLMELVRNTHNLSELAERPMTLKLIGGQIQELEALRARGEHINGAKLYELVAKSWLERDEGKHHLQPEHKLRLMPDLAAHLWRTGARSLPYQDLHRWFHAWRAEQPDLSERYGPAVYNQNKLEEDLRTATFVVREDEGAQQAEGFRFAHSSLLEFFLAKYLFVAIVEDRPERWAMPMPSRESRDFLADLLDIEQHARSRHGRGADELRTTLNRWRKTYRPHASELLLRLAITERPETPRPLLAGFDLRGAQLRGWVLEAPHESEGPLPMQGCQLQGADLRETRFRRVRLDDANFSGARLNQAFFEDCRMDRSHWDDAQCIGTAFRTCTLHGSQLHAAHAYRAQLSACVGHPPALGTAPPTAWLMPPTLSQSTLTRQSLQWLTGHNDMVLALAFAPDGRRIASASVDKTIRVWDAESGEALFVLQGHDGAIQSVAFSPNGQRIASASADQTIRVWDSASGEVLLTIQGHHSAVTSVSFSQDSRRIASASNDTTIRLWDAVSGEAILTLHGHVGAVNAVAFSPNGRRIASVSSDETLRVWDATSGESLLILPSKVRDSRNIAFSPEGEKIVSPCTDNTLCVWDATSGETLISIKSDGLAVHAVSFSPDGQHIASALGDRTIRLWDATTGEALVSFRGHRHWVSGVVFSPDGQRIASASGDKTLRLWDIESGECLITLHGEHLPPPFHISNRPFNAVAFSPDGQRIASTSGDHVVRLWDATSGAALAALHGHVENIHTVSFSPDGQSVASAANDSTLRLWDAASGKNYLTLRCEDGVFKAIAFSPDGRYIATTSNRTVRVSHVPSGETRLILQSHGDQVIAVAFSPDGQRIAAASVSATLEVWDATSGESLLSAKPLDEGCPAFAFSPDGRHIAAASSKGTLHLLDAISGGTLFTLNGHDNWVNAIAFSPDGQLIASASSDHTLRLTTVGSDNLPITFRGHGAPVTAVAFSPDGHVIASASSDRTLRLWNANTGTCLRVHWSPVSREDEGHASWIPPGVEPDHPEGRLISASGDAWRVLGWQVWDHPSAPGQWTRLPLGPYPSEIAAD